MDIARVLPAEGSGARRISPTDVSQFIRLEQRQRYLRLRLHERAHGPRFLHDYGVVPQSIPPLLTRSGAAFERRVEAAIGQRLRTVSFASEGPRPATSNDNAAVVAALRDLPAGAALVLCQPRLQADLNAWRIRGDIDILRAERHQDGALHLLIADMKSSTAAAEVRSDRQSERPGADSAARQGPRGHGSRRIRLIRAALRSRRGIRLRPPR